MPETILLEVADGVALLTLNQPARRNPMSERMGEELAEALRGVEAREDVRVLILAGAGESFCAGGDMALIEANTRRDVEARRQVMRATTTGIPHTPPIPRRRRPRSCGRRRLARAPAPPVRRRTRSSASTLRLGSPGMASTDAPRVIGAARALELFYTGRVVSGREAEAMGLVNRAVAAGELMSTALETARSIAASAPLVVRMLKRAVYQGLESAVTAAVEYEAFCQAITFGSEDLREGLAAARERRAPRFVGR
jgi:enoyl-CoA hydratase